MAFVPGSQAIAAPKRVSRGPGATSGRGGGQSTTRYKSAPRFKWPVAVPIVPTGLAITMALAIALAALMQKPAPAPKQADVRSITVKELYLGSGTRPAMARIYGSY